jgi:hypothetical protein
VLMSSSKSWFGQKTSLEVCMLVGKLSLYALQVALSKLHAVFHLMHCSDDEITAFGVTFSVQTNLRS